MSNSGIAHSNAEDRSEFRNRFGNPRQLLPDQRLEECFFLARDFPEALERLSPPSTASICDMVNVLSILELFSSYSDAARQFRVMNFLKSRLEVFCNIP